MAMMNQKTNGKTKMKKDIEAMKAAASEMIGATKGKKYGAEAMPAGKKTSAAGGKAAKQAIKKKK